MTQANKSVKRRKLKIIAAIPCFDEEQFIGDVVTKARKHVDEVIVVDDGSTDKTGWAASKAGARLITHKKRQGAGAATRSAFDAAKRCDADVLITLDGDGQHNPDEIPQLLAPILCGKADLVVGSRFLGQDSEKAPRYRKFGIDVITWLYNVGSRFKLSDSQSCFRAYTRRLIEAMNITEDGFGFSVQLLIHARSKGFVITETPVSCIYHSNGSTINPVSHGLGVALSVIRLRCRNKVLPKKKGTGERI